MGGSHHCYHSIFSIFTFLIKPLLFIKTVDLLPRRVHVYRSVSKGSVGLAGSSGRLLGSAWGLTCVGVLGLQCPGRASTGSVLATSSEQRQGARRACWDTASA